MAVAFATLALAAAVALPARAASLADPVRDATTPMTGPEYAGGRLVLRLRPDVAHAAWAEVGRERDPRTLSLRRAPALAALSARLAGAWFEPEFAGVGPGGDPDLSTFWIAHLAGGLPLATALDRARASLEVAEASPIAVVPVDPVVGLDDPFKRLAATPGLAVAAPNDSMFGISYWLYQTSRRDLHCLEAWDVSQGDSAVIAVIDTGVLRWHPDLAGTAQDGWGNLWTNRTERDGLPGVDDDGNGFVDDVWGWDFVALDSAAQVRPGEDWRDADNDPNDFATHGTAVASVAAAIANNGSGVVGVAPRARIMALRVGYSTPRYPPGEIDLSAASQAIVYAARNGATVINCSFSSTQQPDLIAAVTTAIKAGVIMVVAGGNTGDAHYLGDRDDVISVGATDQADKVAGFTFRGSWVDLSAPGQSIAVAVVRVGTSPDSIANRTASYSAAEAGTSFASPMVAAAAAILQADRKARGLQPYTPYLAQLRLTETTDNISALNGGTGYGTGRLNVLRALTDPPLSTGFGAGAATIGPAAILPAQSGTAWVAYATADSGLLIMRAVSGDTLVRIALPARPTGGIAAADLGGGLGTAIFVALENGQIEGFRSAGAPLPGWPVDATTTRGEFETMPALGDIDGDGVLEVVWGGDDGSVWAWHADGTRVAGFPRRAGVAGRNVRVALGNLDGQPGLELVVASNNYTLYAFHGDGTSLAGWPVIVGDDPTSPVIMRLGSDPTPTVVVAGGTSIVAYAPSGAVRFRKDLPSHVAEDLAVGDLNGDGRDEIVALMDSPDQLSSIDSTGTVITTRLLTVHSGGPPLVGPLASGVGANVLFPSPDNQARTRYFAFTSTLADLRGWPKSGHPSTEPSMADVDNDGATELAAGSGQDGLIYLYDCGPNSWRPAAARWPTLRGNFARTGSRLDTPTLQPGDDVAPAPVANLAGDSPETHAVTLRWSAPADPGAAPRVSTYDLRMASSPISAATFGAATPVPQAIAPAAPGSPESLRVAGLPESAVRWFAIRSRDVVGNWSPISNLLAVDTPTRSPAVVADLRVVSASDSTLTLAWTASGDDGHAGRAARYVIRLAAAPMDSAVFESAKLEADVPATQASGGTETFTLRNLVRGERWWIGLKAVDAAGNQSAVSNPIHTTVGRLAMVAGVAMLPTRSPSRVPVEIQWQGDPASAAGRQTIEIYDLGGRIQQRFALPHQSSGTVLWDGTCAGGRRAPPGVYFARLESGPFAARGRIVLLR